MAFLPKDYKTPASPSGFMKLQEGDNRFRILSEAAIGWEGWKDNKPFRRPGVEKNINDDEVDVDQKFTKKPKINHIWSFVVWDYESKGLKLFTLTQKTIMKEIDSLVNDEDWGDPKNYDISIEKTVKGARTSYSVKAYPPKKITKDISDALIGSDLDPNDVFKDEDDE